MKDTNIAASNGNPDWMAGPVPPYGAYARPKDEARNLRAEAYNVDGRMRLPIDPYAIASNLGIHVRTASLAADTAGFIIKEQDEDRPTIYLNSEDGEQRRRFTLTYALGHFVTHRNEPVLAYVDKRDELASKGTDPAERWCNAFAAELLMPEAIVKKYWAEGMSSEEIRQKFNVTKAAIAVRLTSLGLI